MANLFFFDGKPCQFPPDHSVADYFARPSTIEPIARVPGQWKWKRGSHGHIVPRKPIKAIKHVINSDTLIGQNLSSTHFSTILAPYPEELSNSHTTTLIVLRSPDLTSYGNLKRLGQHPPPERNSRKVKIVLEHS